MWSSSRWWLVLVLQIVVGEGEWRYGRATYYGNEPWYWSIHHGSCGYGYVCQNVGTGWDVAALPDVHYEYSGSCGRCYEVKCNPMNFHDGYGQVLDRSTTCYNPEESIVVTIVDTCPCNYANNHYSNKRWCCGDMDHFDLSVWAFEKLTELKWGVTGLLYRPVPCDYKPAKWGYPRTAPHWGQEPWHYQAQCPRSLQVRNGQNSHQIPNGEIHVPWPDNTVTLPVPQVATLPPPVQYKQKESTSLFNGGLNDDQVENWNIKSWNAQAWVTPGIGVHGGQALCSNIKQNGALAFQGQVGALKDKVALEFYAKTDHGLPNIAVDVASSSAGCKPIQLSIVPEQYTQNDYTRFKVDFKWFGESDDTLNVFLVSCNQQSVDELEYISFKNINNQDQVICMDQVDLVSDTVFKSEVFNSNPAPAPVPAQTLPSTSQKLELYEDGSLNGFSLSSWNAEAYESPGWGVHDKTAVCAKLYPWGGISLDGPQGSFVGKQVLEFWVRTDFGVPPVVASISNKNSACKNIPLQDIQQSSRLGWYQRFAVRLSAFDWDDQNYDQFRGCSGSGQWQLNKFSLMNQQNEQVWVCFDEVKLWS